MISNISFKITRSISWYQ